MGKCHGVTTAQGIVKNLVSCIAAAQQDNRLISRLSEPYRTILLFLSLILFLLDIHLTLIDTFTVNSGNTFSCRYSQNVHAVAIFFVRGIVVHRGECVDRKPGRAHQIIFNFITQHFNNGTCPFYF